MAKNDVTILVNSCDKYEDAWEPFFNLLKIQWPECAYNIVLSTETKSYACDYFNVKTINTKSDLPWSSRLKEVLKQIETEYVLFFLEDFFLLDKVNVKNFDLALDLMRSDKKTCLVEFPSMEGNYKESNNINEKRTFSKVPLFKDYRAKVMVSLWRTRDFENLVFENEDPWLCEKETSVRSMAYGKKIYCQDYTYSLPVFNYCINPDLGYGITQGKWLVNNKPFFEKNGIHGVNYDNLGILEKPKGYGQLKDEELNKKKEYVNSVLKNKGTGNKIKDVIHIYKRMIMKTLKMDKALKIIKYKKIYKNHQ